jgi:tRNA-specific 2-thiouridylase
MSNTVMVAMSGGVDSSVVALLLRRAGLRVIGAFMSHGVKAERGQRKTCCSADDAHDARRVADHLGIPFYALNLGPEFGRLMDHVAAEYAQGRTPNPCVRCNRWMKFGRLFDTAHAMGAGAIATGHYARLEPGGILRRGVDRTKDQSYVLFNTPRERLDQILLPLGGYPKARVREMAREAGLPVAEKADSQGICFIPDGNLAGFLERRGLGTPGPVTTEDGTVVGRHEGYEFYTVGQRQGLGVALGQPMYVSRVDPSQATVVLAPPERVLHTGLEASHANWLVSPRPEPGSSLEADVQIRYHHEAVPARIEIHGEEKIAARFAAPVRAVTPGQAAVFYRGDQVLGGCWINRPLD